MSEDTSEQRGTAFERDVARKVSGKGGAIVIVAVVLVLALLMAFNMN
jgi:Holliday junction resolvase